MRLRRAFSFVELLVTMAFIGLLARIAIPRYREMKQRAIAASIMADVHTIRLAAFSYYTEHGAFPSEAAPGQLPTELVDGLPDGFSFDRPDFDYDWHVWNVSTGSGTEKLVGITVLLSDPKLLPHLVRTAGAYIPVVTPTQVTFLVSSS